MRVGIKKAFEYLDEVQDTFSNLNAPVELGLPHYREHYMRIRNALPWVASRINDMGVEVLSIHATAMGLDSEIFPTWGAETADFAAAVGARSITIHPNQVKHKADSLAVAVFALADLQMAYKDRVTFSLETFLSNRRIFTPSDIVGFDLPMTLDVTHFRDADAVWKLIKDYRDRIYTVHLSGREGDDQHQPIDDFCREIARYLKKKQWDGNIILEYRDEFSSRLIPDFHSLMSFIGA